MHRFPSSIFAVVIIRAAKGDDPIRIRPAFHLIHTLIEHNAKKVAFPTDVTMNEGKIIILHTGHNAYMAGIAVPMFQIARMRFQLRLLL